MLTIVGAFIAATIGVLMGFFHDINRVLGLGLGSVFGFGWWSEFGFEA